MLREHKFYLPLITANFHDCFDYSILFKIIMNLEKLVKI